MSIHNTTISTAKNSSVKLKTRKAPKSYDKPKMAELLKFMRRGQLPQKSNKENIRQIHIDAREVQVDGDYYETMS